MRANVFKAVFWAKTAVKQNKMVENHKLNNRMVEKHRL